MRPLRSILAAGTVLAVSAATLAGCGDEHDAGPRTVVEFPDSRPGDVIDLRAGDSPSVVEWIDRRDGTIRAIDVDGGGIRTLARIDVGTDGEQRGLLGHTVIDGTRYAAWTERSTGHLVVGEIGEPEGTAPGAVERIVWDGGGTEGGAVGGHLEADADGRLVLGVGQRTNWARDHGSGALLALDPAGPTDQQPEVLSDGYTNPFAFTVADDGAVWVADNAVGDDVERIGRGDRTDRDTHARSDADPRAPSAVVALPDGDLAICGFLDADLRRWSTDPPGYGDPIGPCLTGAARLPDGTIITATDTALVALTP